MSARLRLVERWALPVRGTMVGRAEVASPGESVTVSVSRAEWRSRGSPHAGVLARTRREPTLYKVLLSVARPPVLSGGGPRPRGKGAGHIGHGCTWGRSMGRRGERGRLRGDNRPHLQTLQTARFVRKDKRTDYKAKGPPYKITSRMCMKRNPAITLYTAVQYTLYDQNKHKTQS